MANTSELQYISDADGNPIGVIVPTELWRKIESELKSKLERNGNKYQLRGTTVTFERPTDPVGDEDWEASR